jgi:hypothetical protein
LYQNATVGNTYNPFLKNQAVILRRIGPLLGSENPWVIRPALAEESFPSARDMAIGCPSNTKITELDGGNGGKKLMLGSFNIYLVSASSFTVGQEVPQSSYLWLITWAELQ